MPIKNTSKEHIHRVNVVVNYILEHLADDLKLEKLAEIGNYSPFHFQKIFKQVSGETPKHFIIRMRLENSIHILVAHHHKLIGEIAMDSGFASSSTFARAFKTYFWISADELRNLYFEDKVKYHKLLSSKKIYSVKYFQQEHKERYGRKSLKVILNKVTSFQVAFINNPLADVNKIQDGFKKIIRLAEAYDLLTQDSKFIGIINPHAGLYQTAVAVQSQKLIPKDVNVAEVEGGKFAVCKVKGDILQTFNCLHSFRESWLSKSVYRIKQSYVFEVLTQNPLTKPYCDIPREIYIPIESA